jgi:glycosyltransferase involved in cell wall biosynthesis
LARASHRPVVVHLIPSVGQGGAERLLSDLVARSRDRMEHRILALTATPAFFAYDGARLIHLDLPRRRLPFGAWPRLVRLLREQRPSVLHAWLYHGNLLGALLPRGGARLIWSIHNTSLPAGTPALTRVVNRAGALLSHVAPWRIVYCAEPARLLHESMGYAGTPGLVIENGVDFARFAFSPAARDHWRAAWGLAGDEIAIGCAARFDPQKDHAGLAAAFSRLPSGPRMRLLLAGAGCTPDNAALMAALRAVGVAERTVLLGPWSEMPGFHAAIDLLVIGSAFGEALPMVGLEAAASGLPIVATRLGAAATLVLDPAHLAAPGDPADLARAMASALDACVTDRPGIAATQRLQRLRLRHDIDAVADAYHALYAQAIGLAG